MFSPRSLPPALAAAALAIVTIATPGPALGAPEVEATEAAAPGRSDSIVEADTPLTVSIESLTPAAVPQRGPVRVSGTVTNTDTVTWTEINVYAFASTAPLTTSAELADAVATDPSLEVGGRITTPGLYDEIDSLLPGSSTTFSLTIPRDELPYSEPGVYWFGVHALGSTDAGRVPGADGRARTFLPLVAPPTTDGEEGPEDGPGAGSAPDPATVPVALVLPLRREVRYAADGSLAGVRGWARTLGPGGKLRERVAFGAAAGDRPVSWLLDPALVDAARRLAAGNPGRSLEPTVEPGEPDTDTGGDPTDGASGPGDGRGDGPGDPDGSRGDGSPGSDDGAGESPSPAATSTPTPLPRATDSELGELEPLVAEAARAAAAWLDQLDEALDSREVLLLPYGDLDVPAAAEHAPELIPRTRERSDRALADLGRRTLPAIGSPSGWLDQAAVRAVDQDTLVLLTDEAVPAGLFTEFVPTVLTGDDRRIVLTSSAVAAGGPAPGEVLGPLAVRQRMLAEAALRVLAAPEGAAQPLVVVPPGPATTAAGSSFFAGLDQPWLDLDHVADVAGTAAPPVDLTELEYPETQAVRELDPPVFSAAAALASAGDALQRLLLSNDQVGEEVTDQSYAVPSYGSRIHPRVARRTAERSRTWIADRLSRVTIEAPPAVTLSSASGRFSATVDNGLDQPVRVGINAVADRDLVIRGPEFVDVPAGQQTTVLLTASTTRLGQHNVQLVLVDSDGIPLGSTEVVPIRSAQVSGVIWLFMGGGAALLFAAIVVRLVRRLRARRHEPGAGAA